jgi:hypothetical protein
MAEKPVEHRTYGKGVVKGERYLGNEILVEFQDGIRRWVQIRELVTSESDIFKNAIKILQKSNRILPSTIPHSPPSSIKEKKTAELQTVSPERVIGESAELPLNKEAESETLHEKKQEFDLFEPDPSDSDFPPVSAKEEKQPPELKNENDAIQTIIDQLLQKTRDLEQEPEREKMQPEQDLSHKSDITLQVFQKKIRITEEPVVLVHHGEKRELQKSEIPKSSVREFHITKNHILAENETGQLNLQKDSTTETTNQSNADDIVPVHDETIIDSIPIVSSEPLLEIHETPLNESQEDALEHDVPVVSEVKIAEADSIVRPCSPDRFEARSIIEALRLGVVPHKKVEDFSCGREAESERIEIWLGEPQKACMFFSGEYGSGKSHMLELTAAKALKNNWAVATLEIDPNESPFNQPKMIYRQIIKSFRYHDNDNLSGFRDFILKILNSKKMTKLESLESHLFFGGLISAWKEKPFETDDCFEDYTAGLLDWIEGEDVNPNSLPRMSPYQNTANIYCNILSGIGWAAKNIMNLKGLLILIDEGEGIDKGWYTAYQFERAGNFIKGLVMMADSDPVLHEEFDYMKHYALPRGNKTGKYTGLLYGGTKKNRTSFLWENNSHVKILFSFTPSIVPFVQEAVLMDEGIYSKIPVIDLEELQDEHLKELYHKINSLYDLAYDFSSHDSIFVHLPKDKTRLFVKSVVEALDVMRFNPATYQEELSIPDSLQKSPAR